MWKCTSHSYQCNHIKWGKGAGIIPESNVRPNRRPGASIDSDFEFPEYIENTEAGDAVKKDFECEHQQTKSSKQV